MKKFIALLLALLMMVGILAGCGGDEENPSTDPGTASSDPTTAPSYTGPVEDDPSVSTEIELPLVDDTHTFTWWLPSTDSFEDFSSYDDNMFYQWMEDQTNVHIEFTHPAGGSERESFQTMILSAEYTDFMHKIKDYYDGGVDKAIADGVLQRMNEKVDELMPNYRAMVYADELTFIQAVSDEGNLWGIHHIVDRPQGAWIGLGVRQDWLDKAGIDISVAETVDGIETILTAFKDYTYNNVGPLWVENGSGWFGGGIHASYGLNSVTLTGAMMNVNGTATYGPMTDGFKQYAAKMADWYAKGLIHSEYIATASWGTPEERWANGETGIGDFIYTTETTLRNAAIASELNPQPDFDLSAISNPKLTADQSWSDVHVRNIQDKIRASNSMGISTQCSNLDLACRYWDYAWSDEGKIASNWGSIEGPEGDVNAHYFVDENDTNGDGHKECYQPWMMEKWQNVTYVQTKFAVHNGPTYSIWSREWCVLSEEEIGFTEIWDRVGGDYMWPEGVTLTKDEGDLTSTIVADCNTAVATWLAEVITGEKSVDTYETELRPNLESFGIQTVIDAYQAALTRYNNRTQYLD